MSVGRLVEIRPTLADDFIQLELLEDSYLGDYPRTYEYAYQVMAEASCLLTIHDKYGIITIVGTRGNPVEVFAYTSKRLLDHTTLCELKFMRSLVDTLLDQRSGYMYVYGARAARFSRYLGFQPTGALIDGMEIYEKKH